MCLLPEFFFGYSQKETTMSFRAPDGPFEINKNQLLKHPPQKGKYFNNHILGYKCVDLTMNQNTHPGKNKYSPVHKTCNPLWLTISCFQRQFLSKSQPTFHMTNSQHGIWPVWWLITWPWDIVNQLWVKMLKTSKETILTCSLLAVVNILSKWLCHQNQPRHQSLWMSTSRSGRKRNLKWTWNNNHLFKNNDLDTSRELSELAKELSSWS